MITRQEEKKESTQITRYRPSLSITVELQESIDEDIEQKEIEGYSITPTTFHSRSFFVEPVWYTDTFKYADQEVTRFGINAKLLSSLDIEKEGIKITRVDGTVASSKYQLKDAQKVIHHSLEKHLLQKAIDHLLGNEDCRTALIDVFARVKEEVKVPRGDHPETHTVVLYKNPLVEDGHEITVIDPSNFLFSSHLLALDLGIKHDLLSKITTIHKGLKIYKPLDDNIGPEHNQSRDCIDVAVKIAFGLSQHEWVTINLEEHIKNHPFIQSISSTDLDKTIIVKTVPTRIKQASDINIVSKYHKVSKVLSKNFSIIKSQKLYFELMHEYTQILDTYNGYFDTIKGLLQCNKTLINKFSEQLDSEHQALTGEIYEGI